MHQGSGKQGGDRYPANTDFPEAEFTSILVLSGFILLHCAKAGTDTTGTAAVGASDPAAELHPPMHSTSLPTALRGRKIGKILRQMGGS